jgi:hypothetical protein
MTAEKGNKVYTITEAEKDNYRSQGYDIFEDGMMIACGKGKMVPYEDYLKLQEKNRELKEKLSVLEEEKAPEKAPEKASSARAKK